MKNKQVVEMFRSIGNDEYFVKYEMVKRIQSRVKNHINKRGVHHDGNGLYVVSNVTESTICEYRDYLQAG